MSSEYSFPLLKKEEIRDTLAELQITVTEEELLNPSANPDVIRKIQLVYEQLTELLNQPMNEQPSFDALEELEFPELHDESIPMMSFLKACHKLLTTCGITDFTLDDVQNPDKGRLRRNLSAVINFAKFREDRQPAYVEFTQETDNLGAQKTNLEEENERLMQELAEAKRKRLAEQPQVEALEAENVLRAKTVQELFNQQTECHNECQSLKSQLHAVQDAIREANLQLLDAKAECENLKEQIVPDPRKLKCDVQALRDAEEAEKAAIRALELKLATAAKQQGILEQAELRVDEVIAVQAEVEGEEAKLKDIERKLKENAEKASKDDGERNDQQYQMKGLEGRQKHAEERLERLKEQHAQKREVATKAHADVERERMALEQERGLQDRKLGDNEAALRQLRDKILARKMEHEAEVASVQQQQQLLAAQVRAYHQDLKTAMQAASSSNAVPVS